MELTYTGGFVRPRPGQVCLCAAGEERAGNAGAQRSRGHAERYAFRLFRGHADGLDGSRDAGALRGPEGGVTWRMIQSNYFRPWLCRGSLRRRSAALDGRRSGHLAIVGAIERRHRQPAWAGSTRCRGFAALACGHQGAGPEADGKRRIEVIVSACSLRPIAKNFGIQDVAWLLGMQGVLLHETVMPIVKVTIDEFQGKECLYHLTATE